MDSSPKIKRSVDALDGRRRSVPDCEEKIVREDCEESATTGWIAETCVPHTDLRLPRWPWVAFRSSPRAAQPRRPSLWQATSDHPGGRHARPHGRELHS